MLFVECHRCQTEFPSGVAPVSESPGGVLLVNVLERCPNCQDLGSYNTHEFHFAGPTPIAPPPAGVSVPPSNPEALARSKEDHGESPSVDAPQGERPPPAVERRPEVEATGRD
ncbi:MAG: hypothetical protein L3J91_03705 [Thermoplasmata archaeon]|nr:hypothetical protein [Thermoplasmata archaeon]